MLMILCGCLLAGCVEAKPKYPAYWMGSAPTPLPITPPTAEELRASIDRGIQYLLSAQLTDGSFGTSNPKYVRFDLPTPEHFSFKMATTSLCLQALIENDDGSPEVDDAITRAQAWVREKLVTFRRPNRSSMFNVWGHTYALQALLAILEHRPLDDEVRQQVRQLIEQEIRLLTAYRTLRGGWGYYPGWTITRPPTHWAASFMTGAVLVALGEARDAGFDVPKAATITGVLGLHRSRSPDGSFDYWMRYGPEWALESNSGPGALGRTQGANAGLAMWGSEIVTSEVIEAWVKRLITRNGWLSMARKSPFPHSSHCQIAGYYYYYSCYYGAVCIGLLAEEKRPFYQDQLAKIIISHQDGDGSWWDFSTVDYQQGYGTGFALMALHRCLHE